MEHRIATALHVQEPVALLWSDHLPAGAVQCKPGAGGERYLKTPEASRHFLEQPTWQALVGSPA